MPAEQSITPISLSQSLLIADIEAATLAGVSRAHWHRLRAAGKVPAPIKLGRAVRWNRAEIVAWIEAGCPEARTWAAIRQQQTRLSSRGV